MRPRPRFEPRLPSAACWPFVLSLLILALLCAAAVAKPVQGPHELAVTDVDVDIVGDVDGTYAAPRKALVDTRWIAV